MSERDNTIARIMRAQVRMYHHFAFDRSDPLLTANLTMPQLKTLLVLSLRPEASGQDVMATMGVSLATVTGIIDRLVAEGLVARLAHAGDRRATFVRLTPKGAQQFQAMAKAHEAWIVELLAGVGREDTDVLVGLLGTLRASAHGGEQSI